jgi:drug/metabolite transporter (DMT)-like permease
MMRGVINCLFATLLFAAAMPIAKLLLQQSGPFTLAGLLYVGAAIVAAPPAYRAGISAITRRDLWQLIIIAIAGGLAGPALLMLALTRAPAASISLWLNLEAIATAILAWAFFRENLDYRAWTGIMIVAVAGGILAIPSSTGGLAVPALIGAACLCWALDNNLTSIIENFTPSQITIIKGILGGAFNLVVGVALESHGFTAVSNARALILGAISYGISLMLYISGARQLGAVRAQAIFATAPFAGCVFSWIILDEHVQGAQIAAGLLMAGGISLMYSAHEHVHSHVAQVHTHRHSHDDPHHAHTHPRPVRTHTHEHTHTPMSHSHRHLPELHHRHTH